MKKITLLMTIMLILAVGGCERKIPSALSDLPESPKAPGNLRIAVGDNVLNLSWEVETPAAISKYFLYRSFTSADSLDLYDSTSALQYSDTRVQNGLRYYYQVSALSTADIEGYRSPMVSAVPGIYAISINNDARFTKTRQVNINPTAPERTAYVMLSNTTDFSSSRWQNYASSISWELTDGDGLKTVSARFRDNAGNETANYYSDQITLDTRAEIDTFYIFGDDNLFAAGDVMEMVVTAGENEGSATVRVGSDLELTLFDNGTNGDDNANNGVYQLDYKIPPQTELSKVQVSARFIDRAGNEAPAAVLPYLVTISNPPESPQLTAVGAKEDQIRLSWIAQNISDFGQFRLYRSSSSNVTEGSELIAVITTQTTTTHIDTALQPANMYYYRLYLLDNSGLSAASNIVSRQTTANVAPNPVSLALEIRSTDLRLTWTRNQDTDFGSYRIYRSTTSIPTTNPAPENLLYIENSQSATSFADQGAVAGTTYYYRVFVFDRFGLSAGSNQVSGARTADEE